MTGIFNGQSAASVRASINAVLVTEFEDMAEMLADSSMTYTAGQANTVAAGRSVVLRKEGFRFEVVATDAVNNTATTAGFVKLRPLPAADGSFNWVQIGGFVDGVTDNIHMRDQIIKVWPQLAPNNYPSGTLIVPAGVCYFSDMFVIPRPLHIKGVASGMTDFGQFTVSASIWLFAAGTHGVRIAGSLGDKIGEASATGLYLENLAIKQVSKTGHFHGIWASTKFFAFNVAVWAFSGDGWHIVAQAPTTGNANVFGLMRCAAWNNGRNGLYIDGPDSNASQIVDFNAHGNTGWGIYDSSFLGNHYFGVHTDSNGLGPVRTDNVNAPTVFVGLYTESNQGTCVFSGPTTSYGGGNGTGITGIGNGLVRTERVRSQTQISGLCSIYHVTVANGGSGFTSAPAVTISAPTGAVQATATAVVHNGQITQINLTNRGLGYTSPPTVTITDASGTGATATSIVTPFGGTPPLKGGRLSVILLDTQGSGYVNPTITISPPTEVTATATAIVNPVTGVITRVLITNPGAGYTANPTVTWSGGGGTGAVLTAIVGGTNGNAMVTDYEIGGTVSGNDVLRITRLGVPNEPVMRLRYAPSAAGGNAPGLTSDLIWDENELGIARNFTIIGSKTAFTGGRRITQQHVVSFANGIVLNGQRNISMSATIPPTTGEYARGDWVLAVNPSPSAPPGVVCTTTGLAGSTAVFKDIANLGA
jgi:hypothetical protein